MIINLLFFKTILSLSLFFVSSGIFNFTAIANEAQQTNINKFKNQKKYLTNSGSYNDEYLLGAGDILFISFFGISIFEGYYVINPDGYINLPEVGYVDVKNKTLAILSYELKNLYKEFIKNPRINIEISSYRPVNVVIKGEVKKPGLYKLEYTNLLSAPKNDPLKSNEDNVGFYIKGSGLRKSYLKPKLFDALQSSEGFTNYADLSKISIIRKYSDDKSDGLIQTKINLLALLENGDQSQNISLKDGDIITIPKTRELIKEQILSINKSNLTQNNLDVFISGNVVNPGITNIKSGTTLVQALSQTGGEKTFTGKVRLIRFSDQGNVEKLVFKYDNYSRVNRKNNPKLLDGDIVIVDKSNLGKFTELLSDVTVPLFIGNSVWNLFN